MQVHLTVSLLLLQLVFLPMWRLRGKMAILMENVTFELAGVSLLPRLLPLSMTVTLLDKKIPLAFLGFVDKG